MQESTKARTSHSTIKNEELKRILENIFYTEDLISELTTERDSLRLLLSKEGIRYEDGKYVLPPNASEHATALVHEADKLDEHIIRSTKKIIARQRTATSLINSVKDYRLRLVLIKRFIDNKPLDVISSEMGFSVRHTQRMIKEAMKKRKKNDYHPKALPNV